MKKQYLKPTCKVYDLKHRTMILCASPKYSPTDDEDIEDYDDLLG